MDSGHEHLFSAKFACPICSYSLPELEPRLFSFNNPMGACPRCDGLGAISFFDPKRVVAFPQLSLASGAIKGWDRRNQFYFQMLQSLARTSASTSKRLGNLPAASSDVVLYGSGKETIRVHVYLNERGGPVYERASVRRHPPQPRAALPRNRLAGGARGTGQIPQQQALPRMRRHAAAREARHVKVGGADAIYESARCR